MWDPGKERLPEEGQLPVQRVARPSSATDKLPGAQAGAAEGLEQVQEILGERVVRPSSATDKQTGAQARVKLSKQG